MSSLVRWWAHLAAYIVLVSVDCPMDEGFFNRHLPWRAGPRAVVPSMLLWDDVDKGVAWGLTFLLFWKIQSVKLSAV